MVPHLLDSTPGVERVPWVSKQITVARTTSRQGIGLHGGQQVRLELRPAAANAGVVFFDLRDPAAPGIPALVDRVVDGRLATSLGDGRRVIRTVEHLLAAVWALGVDNLEVWLDADEPPVLDGSAIGWVEALHHAGRTEQDAARRTLQVVRPFELRRGLSRIAVSPSPTLALSTTIAFAHPVVGEQSFEVCLDNGAFEHSVARARTFGFEADVQAMHAAGLARGGSLDNAVVFGAEDVLNEGGLYWPDEPVRHKTLDLVGDLSLLGRPLRARVEAERPGHTVNHSFVEALLAAEDVWVMVDA